MKKTATILILLFSIYTYSQTDIIKIPYNNIELRTLQIESSLNQVIFSNQNHSIFDRYIIEENMLLFYPNTINDNVIVPIELDWSFNINTIFYNQENPIIFILNNSKVKIEIKE